VSAYGQASKWWSDSKEAEVALVDAARLSNRVNPPRSSAMPLRWRLSPNFGAQDASITGDGGLFMI
jgi:hypothetical protein